MFTNHKFLKLVFGIFIYLNFQHINAQDIINFNNGNSVQVKIMEIQNDSNEIVYQYYNDTSGPIFKKSRLLISSIKIGKTDSLIILNQMVQTQDTSNLSANIPLYLTNINQYSCLQLDSFGIIHAAQNYSPYGLGNGVFFSTLFLSPIGGGLISAALNNSTPNASNLNMPITPLLNSPIYQNAYKKEVHKIKKERIVQNYSSAIFLQIILAFGYIVVKRNN
jgi:hypothetical protein